MMKHEFKQKVSYCDTDAYAVVWHGSYLRWMEMGRIALCEMTGHTMSSLDEMDILIPVVELNVRYKSSAVLEEEILIVTELKEVSKISMTFEQKIYNAESKKLHISSTVKIVPTHKDGTIYRKLPEALEDIVQKAQE